MNPISLTAFADELSKLGWMEKVAPFKSKAQQRFMFAAEARGDVAKGTAKHWAHATKDIKKLPERVKKAMVEKTAMFLQADLLERVGKGEMTIAQMNAEMDRRAGAEGALKHLIGR